MLALLFSWALADDVDFRGHIDQARFFIQKQWYDDAHEELEKAVALEDGRIDPETWYLLSMVRFERADVPGARDAAARAHSYARTDEQLQQAAGFSQFLESQFGLLTLTGGTGSVETTIDLSLESVLFDPSLKRYVERLEKRLAGPQPVPITIGLPAGSYLINDTPVTVTPASREDLKIPTRARLINLALAEVEFSAGLSHWMGSEVTNLLPGPTTQLAVTQPIGPIVAGVMVDWTTRPYDTRDQVFVSATGWSLGARVGVAFGPNPVELRPSLGYRFGLMPGIARPCMREADASAWTCGDDGAEQLMIYGVARAHMPQVELAASILDRERPRPIGGGLKVIGEAAFGTLPAAATARGANGEPQPYVVTTEGRRMMAWGLRVLAHCTLAF